MTKSGTWELAAVSPLDVREPAPLDRFDFPSDTLVFSLTPGNFKAIGQVFDKKKNTQSLDFRMRPHELEIASADGVAHGKEVTVSRKESAAWGKYHVADDCADVSGHFTLRIPERTVLAVHSVAEALATVEGAGPRVSAAAEVHEADRAALYLFTEAPGARDTAFRFTHCLDSTRFLITRDAPVG